tara:strand:- start:17529 stop:18908 length:1380 start_codon:yes stop_codon:yes gene_type:complete
MKQTCVHIAAVSIITFLLGLFYITDRTPYSDEYVYLGHAHTLYSYGVFGSQNGTKDSPKPDARFAPLYPVLLAVTMHIDEDFAKSTECYLSTVGMDENSCSGEFYTIKVIQLLIFSLSLGYIWYLLTIISSSKLFSYSTVGLLLFSGTPFYYADHFLTESLYLALAFIFLLTLPLAILRQSTKYTIISAVFLALTALTRPTFLYLFYLLIFIFPIVFFTTKAYFLNLRSFFRFYFSFLIIFSMVVAPWITRNVIYFDKFAMTMGYSTHPLSTRVAHNEMTNMEYLAGWIYWLPDFGDSLAEKIFGYENVHRLSFSSPESFYPAGRQKVDKHLNELMDTRAVDIKYSSRLDALLKTYVYSDILNHMKVTLLLAWRGFFVDKYFAFIGLFFLIWALFMGIKEQYIKYFHIILFPSLILLFFQAAISVSIPRYNLILLLPLSISYASFFCWLGNRYLNKNLN